jgi:hypothetical protein
MLVATVANPNNETFQMAYDALGLLDRDTGADNGFLQIVRMEDADFTTVSATTPSRRANLITAGKIA